MKEIEKTQEAELKKSRYSDEELDEFRQIILNKLDKARSRFEIAYRGPIQ